MTTCEGSRPCACSLLWSSGRAKPLAIVFDCSSGPYSVSPACLRLADPTPPSLLKSSVSSSSLLSCPVCLVCRLSLALPPSFQFCACYRRSIPVVVHLRFAFSTRLLPGSPPVMRDLCLLFTGCRRRYCLSSAVDLALTRQGAILPIFVLLFAKDER
jgi:hypothetical protein